MRCDSPTYLRCQPICQFYLIYSSSHAQVLFLSISQERSSTLSRLRPMKQETSLFHTSAFAPLRLKMIQTKRRPNAQTLSMLPICFCKSQLPCVLIVLQFYRVQFLPGWKSSLTLFLDLVENRMLFGQLGYIPSQQPIGSTATTGGKHGTFHHFSERVCSCLKLSSFRGTMTD